jgi:hypothetical protein
LYVEGISKALARTVTSRRGATRRRLAAAAALREKAEASADIGLESRLCAGEACGVAARTRKSRRWGCAGDDGVDLADAIRGAVRGMRERRGARSKRPLLRKVSSSERFLEGEEADRASVG